MSMTYLAAVPLLLILYIYAGYPILLKIVSLLRGKGDVEISKDRDDWPTLSIVVTAHNAAHLISEKLSNLSLICLLYTSPSPRDLSTSRMPSSA